ncbi:MAG: hypothetical protein GY719_23335 [bacterium]|nr:hypothetical protein [bacterium]
MTHRVVEIFLPCEVFDVEVVLAPDATLSPLELLALKALNGGVERFEELSDLFGMGQRPTLTLVFDLWRAGLLSIDLARNQLQLVNAVRERLENGELEDLSACRRVQRSVGLMQELISGNILPLLELPRQVRGGYVSPESYPYGSFRRAPRAEMLDVLSRLATRLEEAHPMKVLGFHLKSDSLVVDTPGRRRLLRAFVECRRSRSGRLTFRLVEPAELSGKTRQDIEGRLSVMAEDMADELFFKNLRQGAEVESSGVAARRQPVAGLRLALGELDSIDDPGEIDTHHEKLLEHAVGVQDLLRRRHLERARVQMLVHTEKIKTQVHSDISVAKKQLVLGIPRPHYHRNAPWVAIVRRLLKQRDNGPVKVFFYWGAQPDDELESGLSNLFEDLGREGRFFWSSFSACSRSFFLVRDMDLVVTGNADVLTGSPSKEETLLCLRLRAREGEVSCQAALDLLDHVYRTFPNYEAARQILTLPEEGWPPAPSEGAPREVELPREPDLEEVSEVYARALLSGWKEDWRNAAEVLFDRHEHSEETATLVSQGEQRDRLLELAESAKQRVVIASGELSEAALDDNLFAALGKAKSAQASIQLLYGQVRRHEQAAGSRLRKLAKQHLGERKVHQGRVLGGLAIMDDTVMLSSMHFLANSRVSAGLRKSREWGIVARSREAADTAIGKLTELGVPPTASTRMMPERAVDKRRSEVPLRSRLYGDLRELVENLARAGADLEAAVGADPGKALALEPRRACSKILGHWLEDPASKNQHALPWLLRELPHLRPILLAGYLEHGLLGPGETVQHLAELTARHWQEGSFHEAAVLLADLGELDAPPAALPPLWLAMLAAQAGDASWLASHLLDLAERELSGPQRVGVAAVACLAVTEGVEEATLALLELAPRLPPPLARWSAAILSYYSCTGNPIPQRGFIEHEAAAHRAQEARRHVEQTFEEMAELDLHTELASAAWSRLLDVSCELGRCLADAQASRPDAAVMRVSGLKREGLERLIKGTIRGMRSQVREKGHFMEMDINNMLAATRRLIDATETWTAEEEASQHAEQTAALRPELDVLVEELRSTRPQLGELAESREESVEGPVLRLLLDRLSFLT